MAGKIIAVDGVPVQIRKSNFAAPGTVGERAADTAHQQADREAITEQRALEREQVTLYSIFNAHGTPRARQLEASARLDEVEARLANLRANLASKTQRVAKRDLPDPLAGFGSDRRRGADALMSVLTAPSTDLKKAVEEAAAVEKLDQSLGVNGSKPVKSATKMVL